MEPVALGCIGILAALLFGLGLAVSVQRFRTGTLGPITSEQDSRLQRLIRAHGNTAEHAPMLAILMGVLGSAPMSSWVNVCVVAATLSRIALVIGLICAARLDHFNAFRFVGALGTYCFGAALAAALVLRALQG